MSSGPIKDKKSSIQGGPKGCWRCTYLEEGVDTFLFCWNFMTIRLSQIE
jgi:hypothetical protein